MALIGIRPGWLLTVLTTAETVRPALVAIWIGPVPSIRPARLIVSGASPVSRLIAAVERSALVTVRPALVAARAVVLVTVRISLRAPGPAHVTGGPRAVVGASARPVRPLLAVPAAAARLGLIARRRLAERTHLARAARLRRRVCPACGVDA